MKKANSFFYGSFRSLTGLIPALIGKKFIYVTIYFVESFIEKHYDEQILKHKKKNSLKLIQLLKH